jgi:hypothetical protein
MMPSQALGVTPSVPVVKFLDDTKVVKRSEDVIKETWDSIRNRNGKIRRTKRGLTTFYNTSIKTTKGVDVVESLVAVGTGIGIAVLSSSVIALSVGSMGALPIAMVMSFILAILAKRFFNLIRSTIAKSRALDELNLIADSFKSQIKIQDSDLAAAFINEIYKDIKKIDALLDKNASPEDKKAVRSTYTSGEAHRKLSKNNFLYKTSIFPFEFEIGSRLKRIDTYVDWLNEYFDLLQKDSNDLLDDNFKQTEEWIYRNLILKAAVTNNHRSCTNDICFQPEEQDLTKLICTNNDIDAYLTNSKITDIAVKNRGKSIQQVANTAPQITNPVFLDIEEEDDDSSEVKEAVGLVVFDSAIGLPFAISTNPEIAKNAVDPIANAANPNGINAALIGHASPEAGQTLTATVEGAAASSAAFAPLGFALGKGIEAAIEYYKTNLPVQNKVNAMRKLLQNDASTEDEIKEGMEEMLKGIDEKMALRALNKCTNHYPKRIHARLKKLQDMCSKLNESTTSLNSRYESVFSTCGEAQAFVRHILKVHHYIDKQAVHIAMIRSLIQLLQKRAYRENS